MDLHVDVRELRGFSAAMAGSPAILRSELATGVNATNVVGVGLAQEYAPVKDGNLRADITMLQTASPGNLSAAYGPKGIVYARMREYGGTIHGRPWLVFQVNGRWVKVRSVTQRGSFYMKRSVDSLRPRFTAAMQASVDRALSRMGL